MFFGIFCQDQYIIDKMSDPYILAASLYGSRGGDKSNTMISQLRHNKQDEKKLIERSLKNSYLACMSHHKINNIDDEVVMMQSVIMNNFLEEVVEKQQDNDNEELQCNLDVTVLAPFQQTAFWCCGDSKPVPFENTCTLTDLTITNQLITTNIFSKISQTYNFSVLLANIQEIEPKDKQEIESFILKFGEKYSLKFSLPCGVEEDKSKKFNKFKERLQKRIICSDAYKYKIYQITNLKDFQQHKYKLEREFVKQCQTGDILLFQSPNFFAKAQRFLTTSDFDHVGVIIKDPVYDILIYQSNSNTGVCLTPWKLVVKYKWYEHLRFCWRKLQQIQRDSYFIEQFHEFVMQNIKTKYHISFDKIFSNQSYIAQREQEQGYFCSELVAKVYKKLNLLPTDESSPGYKPACNFYPYHFSEKAKLTLSKGKLSPQYEIVFNQNCLNDDYK